MCGVEQEFPLPNPFLRCYVERNAIPFSERFNYLMICEVYLANFRSTVIVF